ncbi:WD40 repeat domain-containing protein, partial [Bradyrhizobium sp. 21]|uniref:WD40 repeat domain-containing protein n=1 Tax=Bradyrhizobium sp. 21 TaxID=2782666 RepID=UPI001FF9B711
MCRNLGLAVFERVLLSRILFRMLHAVIPLVVLMIGLPLSGTAHSADSVEVVPNSQSDTLNSQNAGYRFSPDGLLLAKGSVFGPGEVRDVKSGRLLRTLEENGTWPMAFSPDSKTLLFGSRPVKSLNLLDGSIDTAFEGSARVLDFMPDGHSVLALWSDRAEVWDLTTARLLRGKDFKCCASGNSMVLATGHLVLVTWNGDDSGGLVWDTQSGLVLRSYKETPSCLSIINGQPAVIFVRAHSLDAVSPRDGRLLRTTEIGKIDLSTVPTISCSNSYLALSKDGETRIWRMQSSWPARKLAGTIAGLFEDKALTETLDPETNERFANLWNVETGKLIQRTKLIARGMFGVAPVGRVVAHSDRLDTVAVVADGILGLAAGHVQFVDPSSGRSWGGIGAFSMAAFSELSFFEADRSVYSGGLLWDLHLATRPQKVPVSGFVLGRGAQSKDAKLVVVSNRSGKKNVGFDLVNLQSGAVLGSFESNVVVFAISPKAPAVAFRDSLDDHKVRMWNAERKSSSEFVTVSDYVDQLMYSPDGHWLAIADRSGNVQLVNELGRVVTTIATHRFVKGIAFSRDGTFIALAADNGVVGIASLVNLSEPAVAIDLGDVHDLGGGSLAFSPSGRFLAVGFQTSIFIVDRLTRQVVRKIKRHLTNTGGIFWADNDRIGASEGGGAVRIWDSKTGNTLISLYGADDGNWAAVTPEGFFDGSAEGIRNISIVKGLQVYSIDQVYNVLYRPDMVRAKLAGDPDGKVKAAAAQLDLNKVMASGAAPQVTIASPVSGISSAVEEIEVQATIADQGGGVGNVEWHVNGMTFDVGARGIKRIENSAGKANGAPGDVQTVTRRLKLELGDNRIEVLVYNAQNLIASEPVQITVKWDGDKAVTQPKLYIVSVGVNDYYDSRLHLAYAVPDA